MNTETCTTNCGCDQACNCDRTTEIAQWAVHKAKMQLLHERIKQELNAKHGAQLDEISKLVVEIAHADDAHENALSDKRTRLSEKLETLFG